MMCQFLIERFGKAFICDICEFTRRVREKGSMTELYTVMGRSNATSCYYKVIFIDKSSACFDSGKESKMV